MASVMLCSDKCKKARKATLPKKLSVVSVEYWTNKGYSTEQAILQVTAQQRMRSRRCAEYWIKQGFSERDAVLKVSEYQRQLSQKSLTLYTYEERQERSVFSIKHWIKQGYTEEEAQTIVRKNSDSTSLSYHIERYGEIEGSNRHAELCTKRKNEYTLAGYIQKYGETIGSAMWSSKFKNRHNSKMACNFFEQLVQRIPVTNKIYTALNKNGEYGIMGMDNQYYFYDFVIPDLKLCVEYHGDYWHCNPKKYEPFYFHKQYGLTAEQIWNKDKNKQQQLKNYRDIETIVVWESDDVNEKLDLIMEKIYESTQRKNQE